MWNWTYLHALLCCIFGIVDFRMDVMCIAATGRATVRKGTKRIKTAGIAIEVPPLTHECSAFRLRNYFQFCIEMDQYNQNQSHSLLTELTFLTSFHRCRSSNILDSREKKHSIVTQLSREIFSYAIKSRLILIESFISASTATAVLTDLFVGNTQPTMCLDKKLAANPDKTKNIRNE